MLRPQVKQQFKLQNERSYPSLEQLKEVTGEVRAMEKQAKASPRKKKHR